MVFRAVVASGRIMQRSNNRVAIFPDRETERKDPDYDRSYDRYMQRFDPGFGFSNGPYTMQPMYAPGVNYNTEFPQLGATHRPQLSSEHQPCPLPQHMPGYWTASSTLLDTPHSNEARDQTFFEKTKDIKGLDT